jgi:hypothetical protein
MKRVIILLMISGLFCSTQLWGQEKNQSLVGATSVNTAVKGGTYLAPVTVQKSVSQQTTVQPSSGTGAVNPSAQNVDQSNDLPKMINTGNPQKDMDAYEKAKEEWIKNNPEKYNAMKQSNNPQE